MGASVGDRGKSAEKEAKKILNLWDKQADFAYYRLPDARAGSKAPTLADFLLMDSGVMRLLEVKEVAHDFRLPYQNFAVDKVARMKKFVWAGAKGTVWVYSTTTDEWRTMPGEFFFDRDTSKPSGSWDLRAFTPEKELRKGMLWD